ncbi:MAG: hypothetical protein JST04_06225 [Bdellovibrionales bacterium]|nr:hypothetical protein [Bdellovibrionales bacterium]
MERPIRNLLFALSFVLAGLSPAKADGVSLTVELLRSAPDRYEAAATELRISLTGGPPRKFTVDGTEYVGVYFRSGNSSDLYKIYREGKVTLLRIPNTPYRWRENLDFAAGIQSLRSRGFATPEVFSPAAATKLTTEVEYLPDFEEMGDVLIEIVRSPEDEISRAKFAAIRDFVRDFGREYIPDGSAKNLGLDREGNRYVVKVVDTQFENWFPKANTPDQSEMGMIFSGIREKIRDRLPIHPELHFEIERELNTLSDLEHEAMSQVFPDFSRREVKLPPPAPNGPACLGLMRPHG